MTQYKYVQEFNSKLEVDNDNMSTAYNAGDPQVPSIEEILKTDETLTADETEMNEQTNTTEEFGTESQKI